MKLTGKLKWGLVDTGRICKDFANALSIPAFSERQSVVAVAETSLEEALAFVNIFTIEDAYGVIWGIGSGWGYWHYLHRHCQFVALPDLHRGENPFWPSTSRRRGHVDLGHGEVCNVMEIIHVYMKEQAIGGGQRLVHQRRESGEISPLVHQRACSSKYSKVST